MKTMSLAVAACLSASVVFADAAPRFTAPVNQQELDARMGELRTAFAPFLRSLPPPAKSRMRESLPKEWKFTYEAKDSPKKEGIPPAPEWQGVAFNDGAWEATTVPEWRYRTLEGDDTARNPDKVDQWKNSETTADTICWYRTAFPATPPPAGDRLWLCFDGVEWEAQVWLNGEPLGTHRVYYEPFRFDVTEKIRATNALAVRVISGRSYGEPMTYWGLFPDIRAKKQRYTPDRAQSIPGNLPIGYHAGCGFGIFREVYLERSGPVLVREVFARNDLADGQARVQVELDRKPVGPVEVRVEVMPENFEGPAFSKTVRAESDVAEIAIPMPGAKVWSPDAPNLYRCRVIARCEGRESDVRSAPVRASHDEAAARTGGADTKDVLFGCRSFTLVNTKAPPYVPAYSFAPVKARWLRILGRASDASEWNSIREITCAARAGGPAEVTASKVNKQYPPALAVDGRPDTRWALEGRGEWIQFPLDPAVTFDRVEIGWYEAESRNWDFDLLVSDDGKDWRKLEYRPPAMPATSPRPGQFVLNGKPVYLRGSNIQGFNLYAYWGQTNELLDALLLLKAANFNAVRSCQHVEFPEVLEWMDRTGMMSEQDQGGGYRGSIDMGIRREQHIHTGTVLARRTYNHPGVVLLCFGNEHEFPTEPIVRAALAVDPQRIFKPISGRFSHSGKPWDLPEELRANALDDGHPYSGWYGNNVPQTWSNLKIFSFPRMVTLGEYGAEALDAYETMRDHYPPQFKPPAPEADTLWAASQVQKHDVKQIAGLSRNPTNLAEYIEASQNYQEALMADKTIGMRLSPASIAGYFHFHFMDVVPVFWPKSIVSFDHRPKKAYYAMAQVNQPLTALPQLTGAHPDAMKLWIANDLPEAYPGATLRWRVSREGLELAAGGTRINVPATGVARGPEVDLKAAMEKAPAVELELTVTAADGTLLSRYRRTVRGVPVELLKQAGSAKTADPFNKKK